MPLLKNYKQSPLPQAVNKLTQKIIEASKKIYITHAKTDLIFDSNIILLKKYPPPPVANRA
jgi:hypothetical protein